MSNNESNSGSDVLLGLIRFLDSRHLVVRFVCATNKQTSETITLASYRRARGGNTRLTHTRIWEAARATSAASSFFDPITRRMGQYDEEFVDGATGANNPVHILWNEVKDLCEAESVEFNIQCLVSVGTGVPSPSAFRDDVLGITDTLTRISTETETTAEVFQRAHSDLDSTGRYFRFNVRNGLERIGLEDSKSKDHILTITERYIETQDAFKAIKQCTEVLAKRESLSLFA